MPTMTTFVFMDLEATGLNKPGQFSRITEMCFIAVHRSSLLESPSTGPKCMPRIVDKLVLCVDPNIKEESHILQLTGLSQELLQKNGRGIFSKDVGNLVLNFLERQKGPICLIAHGGERFDFPKLANHLRKVGITIPSDIRCGCTFLGFKAVKGVKAGGLSLPSLYERYVGSSMEAAHNAEDDTIALVKLVQSTANDLVPWFDRRAGLFSHQSESD